MKYSHTVHMYVNGKYQIYFYHSVELPLSYYASDLRETIENGMNPFTFQQGSLFF